MSFIKSIQQYSIFRAELKNILFWAFILRLCAVIFSEGYGMHDDHFLIIESSSSWVDGYDYNNWLPWTVGNNGIPSGHSFTYVGLNYIFFECMDFLGLDNPKLLMFLNRFIHALWSLLIVLYSYKITLFLSDKKTALLVSVFMAFTWIIPFMSVRNLVEFVPIPFLLMSIYYVLKNDHWRTYLLSGILVGFAISFRYQIAVFALGMGLVFLYRLQIKACIFFALGFLFVFSFTQGLVDYMIWGKPFAEFIAYSTYNMNEGTQYLKNQNYFMYVGVLMGIMLFPLGILLFVGFLNSFNKYALLFVPSFLFLLFHTIYPNRQERFILTILPLFILLGILGYQQVIRRFNGKQYFEKIWSISLRVFWVINIPLLLFFSFTSSKISRVNAMYSLYNNTLEDEKILIEASGEANPEMMPKFYGKSWKANFYEKIDTLNIVTEFSNAQLDYIFFFGEQRLKQRIELYKKLYPKMSIHSKCYSNFMDKTLNKINPRNSNQYIEVWKTKVR
ncbi:MAG: glycosyltransferase family 39 protein [Flavobacteriia bacterium]|nr:glycosyltransferase family 39 protein [Flavobacteriia bacterium]